MRKLNRYDFLAPYYDRLAAIVFGKSIWKSQVEFIHVIPDHTRILILGGGTGQIAKELLLTKKDCKIWYVEASSAMISIARIRVANHPNIVFIHGTEEHIPIQSFDVIITGFFVDQFSESEITEMVSSLHRKMNPAAVWLVTDFVNEKWWHRMLLKVMYIFFRLTTGIPVTTLPRWEQIFNKHLKHVSEHTFYSGFIKSVLFRA